MSTADKSPNFFQRYKYQILVPLILFAVLLITVIALSTGKNSPFTYATF